MNPPEFTPPMDIKLSPPAARTPRHPSTDPGHVQDQIIVQRDVHERAIGRLLHGNTNDDGTMYVHFQQLDLRKHHAGYARKAIATLIARAVKQNARTILMKTTADVEQIRFWRSCSFLPIAITTSGTRRTSTVLQFEMTLPCRTQKLDAGRLPNARHPNA